MRCGCGTILGLVKRLVSSKQRNGATKIPNLQDLPKQTRDRNGITGGVAVEAGSASTSSSVSMLAARTAQGTPCTVQMLRFYPDFELLEIEYEQSVGHSQVKNAHECPTVLHPSFVACFMSHKITAMDEEKWHQPYVHLKGNI